MKIQSDLDRQTTVTLNQAILLYHVTSGAAHNTCSVIATVHDVIEGAQKRPTLGPGVAATKGAITDLARSLMSGLNTRLEFVSPTIIAAGLDCLVWYAPATRRQLWFKPSSMAGEKKVNAGLLRVSGETFPQPPLLFCATEGNFRVFALKENTRPTPRTRLCRAPYWNTQGDDGVVCIGSTRFPSTLSPSTLPEFEKAYFKSEFTHPTGGVPLTRTPHARLWPALKGRRQFPAGELIETKVTLEQFLRDRNQSRS